MNKYRNLLRKVTYLESLLIEGKRDQEELLNFLGQDYYDKYIGIRDKITDPEWKDYYKLMKKNSSDVKDYIDDFQSNMDLRREAKKGAKLIYNKNGWKVYRITTYEAAVYYGSNTKWCISGNYAGHTERGEEYFYGYIEDMNLDDGYYFYINNNNEKYCLLREKSGEPHSVWTESDYRIQPNKILDECIDFPTVDGIFNPWDYYRGGKLFSDNIEMVRLGIKEGLDVNERVMIEDEALTPIVYHVRMGEKNSDANKIINLLLENGADINKPANRMGDAFTPLMAACEVENPIMVFHLLRKGANPNFVNSENEYAMSLIKMTSPRAKSIIELLLEYNADPNIKDALRNTPIMHAASNNRGDIVRLLLRNGADVNDIRRRFGKNKAIDFLEKSGLSEYISDIEN